VSALGLLGGHTHNEGQAAEWRRTE
jgi:hypothetical protein